MLHLFVNTENLKDPTFKYISGYSPEFGLLFYDDITKKKCMFVVGFEASMYKKIKCFTFNTDTLKKTLLLFFSYKKIKKIGINNNFITISLMKRLKKLLNVNFFDNSKIFSQLRIIKDKKEIICIKKASKITELIYADLVKNRNNFKTENDIQKFLKLSLIKRNVLPAFDFVVATSKNAAEPHHFSNNTKLSGFTVIDFGVKYNGYCSDMTRMFYYGKPTTNEIKLYEKLLFLYDQVSQNIHLGIRFSVLDKIVRDELGKYFIHSLGHGVGIQIHELPNISLYSKDVLKQGMVFTIEPGIYVKNKYGIRFENTVVFLNSKLVELTNSSNKLVICSLKK